MQKCKKADTHSYVIDTPSFFDKDKPEVEEYYRDDINAILTGTDKWFYKRTTVFTHLKCEFCQKEEHVNLPAHYLQMAIENHVRFGIHTVKRLQITLPDGEIISYDVDLFTGDLVE